MGTLSNKYPNSTSVEEALDKGVAAYTQSEENETDILSLQSEVGYINEELFDYIPDKTDISQINGVITLTGHSAKVESTNKAVRIDATPLYDTYYFIAMEDCDIYVDGDQTGYYAIVVGRDFQYVDESSGAIRLISSTPTRYRIYDSEDTVPRENSRLHIDAGDVVAFTVTAGTIKYINGITSSRCIKESFKETITAGIIEEAVSEIITQDVGISYTETSAYDNTFTGYAKPNGTVIIEGYASYCLTVSADTDLYVETANSDYLSICVYDDENYTNGVRYRKNISEGSLLEDTLPYIDDPLSLTTGQYIIISTKTDDISFSVKFTEYIGDKILNNDILLSTEQLNQIKTKIENETKCNRLRYVGSNGLDNSTERVEIYIPTGSGYIEYDFLHCQKENKNSNIWRMGYVYQTDDNFNKIRSLTVGGEWEMAIRMPDRPDFSGGYIHGDEVVTDVVFFVNGKATDVMNLTQFTQFKELSVVETSNVYDPLNASKLSDAEDTKTLIAEHGSIHAFTENGLTIKQSLNWKVNTEITTCYMAMHLPSKDVTDHVVLDTDLKPCDIVFGDYSNIKSAIVYGENSGVKTEFSVGEYPTGYTDSNTFLLTDNNGNGYNKCYFVISSSGNVTDTTVWKTETIYKFEAVYNE